MLGIGSLRIDDQAQNRSTCNFTLRDPNGVYTPQTGHEVLIYDDAGDLVFGGSIERPKRRRLISGGPLETTVACVDFNQIADRHIVARTYSNTTAGEIVRDIVTNDLAGEGISVIGSTINTTGSQVGIGEVGSAEVGTISHTGVQNGPVIDEATFVYQTAAECFSDLAELIGFYWNIGYDKLLTFAPPEQVTAPFAVAEGAGIGGAANFRDMSVEESRDQYRNRQYVRAGTDVTDPRTETFKGDGNTKTFTLAFPAATEPVVEVSLSGGAFTAKTVGIGGVETGMDWYWNKGENTITQDDAGTALTSSDVLRVNYQGSFPIIVASAGQDEINARAAIEGGSGIYEDLVDAQDLDSLDLAIEKAASLLRRYASIPASVEFETDVAGLRAGQLVHITSSEHSIDADFFIENVSSMDIGAQDRRLRTTVTAVSGERLDNWIDFFRRMVTTGRHFVLRENEALALGRTAAETVTVTDELTVTSGAYAGAIVGTAVTGFSEVA